MSTATKYAQAGVRPSIGAKLRAARQAKKMSLRALGRKLEVTPSLLSQIENGRANPSVTTLYSLVSELDLSLDELFSDSRPARPDPAPAADGAVGIDTMVLRARDRPTIEVANRARWSRLTPTPEPSVDFMYVTYEAGGASCAPDGLITHAGHVFGLVVEGRIGATIGAETCELELGDSMAFPGAVPHRFWSLADRAAAVVWTVIGRTGRATIVPQG
jgi:transcriptional regulator with XRE-family HTH domain/mannose-6-phosphate isomerase-like protein (cupin superfamily)